MKRYRVTGFSVLLANGVVKLSEAQASIRKNSLEPVDELAGLFEITRPIQFKSGEVFGYSDELPKTHLEELEELETEKRPRRTKAEVEADGDAEGEEAPAPKPNAKQKRTPRPKKG